MAQAVTTGKKIMLKGNGTDFSFKDVDFNATDEQLYELAAAVNSLQANAPAKIVKVIEKAIF